MLLSDSYIILDYGIAPYFTFVNFFPFGVEHSVSREKFFSWLYINRLGIGEMFKRLSSNMSTKKGTEATVQFYVKYTVNCEYSIEFLGNMLLF